jgi:hypothetical protein
MTFDELQQRFPPVADLCAEARAAVRTLPGVDYRRYLECSTRFNNIVSDCATAMKKPLSEVRSAALVGLAEIYREEVTRQ